LPTRQIWSDLDMDFTAHPNTNKLVLKKDADAVINSVKNLLLINHYEKPFHPEIGSNLTKQLFEPVDVPTSLRIKQSIQDTINNFEPRVIISSLDVDPKEDENGYRIFLKFFIVNEEVERQTYFFLERLR
jgi:phage baseplate assembly protein W